MAAPTYEKLTPPTQGTRVTVDAGGSGRSPTIPSSACCAATASAATSAASRASPPAPSASSTPPSTKAYKGKRKIHWFDVHAGDVAREMYYPAGQGRAGRLPQRGRAAPALPARRHAQGLRVLQPRPQGAADHAHRRRLPQHQRLPAHALRPVCLRPPGALLQGVEAPNKRADKVNMVIFRENTEDVYCGIEFKSGSDKAKQAPRPAQGDGLQRAAVVGHRHQADEPGGDASGWCAWPSATPSTRSCPA